MSRTYGQINGHLIGLAMKEAVRRAIRVIEAQRFVAEVQGKVTDYNPDKADFVTSADKAAQEVYVRLLRESFPDFGIVAEEDHLSVNPESEIYFTVDPLDGTRAFIRQQSHGVGTMISLVCNGEIIAAYVGDVLTGEIYGYRPDSDNVHRVTAYGRAVPLAIDSDRALREQYVLLRDEPGAHSDKTARLIHSRFRLFKSFEITGGSIGISMARLWKGEVGAAILRPGPNTPWDLLPILGISQKLGFVFMGLDPRDGNLFPDPFAVTKEIQRVGYETLVVHESRVPELRAWFDAAYRRAENTRDRCGND